MLKTFNLDGKSYPPAEETARILTYETNRRLYDGYLNEELPKSLQKGRKETDVINWFAGIADFWADNLAGAPPTINIRKNDKLQDLVDGINFQSILSQMIIDYIRFGDAVLRVRVEDDKGYIYNVDPSLFYPVLKGKDNDNPAGYLLAWAYYDGKDTNVPAYSKVDGTKSTRVWQGDNQANKLAVLEFNIDDDKGYEKVYSLNGRTIKNVTTEEEFELGGVSPIIHIAGNNTADRYYGVSMYKNLYDLVAAYNKRYTGIKKIMNAHTDPNLYGDESTLGKNADGSYKVSVGGKFFPVARDGTVPGYLTWDGQLESNFRFLDITSSQILSVAGISPQSYGFTNASGAAQSAGALRRWNARQIAKSNKIREDITNGLIKAIMALGEMIDAVIKYDDVNIVWDDFINDEIEVDKTLKMYELGLYSKNEALSRIEHQPLSHYDAKEDYYKSEIEAMTAVMASQVAMGGDKPDAVDGKPGDGDDGKGGNSGPNGGNAGDMTDEQKRERDGGSTDNRRE